MRLTTMKLLLLRFDTQPSEYYHHLHVALILKLNNLMLSLHLFMLMLTKTNICIHHPVYKQNHGMEKGWYVSSIEASMASNKLRGRGRPCYRHVLFPIVFVRVRQIPVYTT